jgi:hypothetical protein
MTIMTVLFYSTREERKKAASKATLALVLGISRLNFARQQPAAPVLSLPMGR